jgi:plastocyanin
MLGKTIAIIAAVAALTAGIAASAFAATTHVISVRDDSFSRSSIAIPRGDKITWKWRGTDNDHNVTSGSNNPVAFHSRDADGRFSYSHRFSKRGTYRIFCSIHPSSMRITVKVKRG